MFMYTQAGGKLQEHTRVCILRLVENNRNTHEDVYTQTVWKENHGSVSGQITGIFTSILTFFP